ncbi:Lacal_2735 family protein [Mariniflexile litorale]|uniref:Lacal_2735 family protein n=1 Tax=Mariniflexile litorale TaxID=3045158 RepID=A0AAU7EFV4_9FLAO|nr:Lacal_2735 family protein [Mariniflexile sp. KMM 9835]MDQ8211769.1 Lacal_2735 family protein [Mariniflexile sp. KMM 9835]
MFKLFRKKSEVEKLESTFKKLMKEWHELSSVNRKLSDDKYAMAQALVPRIEQLKRNHETH